MEFKTMQYQKRNFYKNVDFLNEPFIIKANTDFEIHVYWAVNIHPETKKSIETAARFVCSLIQSKAIHIIYVCNSDINQYSIPLALIDSYFTFKDMYSKSAHSEIKKSILKNNLNFEEEQCDSCFFYSMAQLQAFGFETKNQKSYIGFSSNPTNTQILEQILNTLGRIPSFKFKMQSISYMSLLSLCSYKSENARTNSTEYGSYFSIDNGISELGTFKDDDSLELNETDFVFLLDALGYKVGLVYIAKKISLIQNELITPIYHNFANSEFKKTYSIFPELPKGLELNDKGFIVGTPMVATANTIYSITTHDKVKYRNDIELEVKEVTQPYNISSGLMTAFVLLLVLVIAFALVALGYKAYH